MPGYLFKKFLRSTAAFTLFFFFANTLAWGQAALPITPASSPPHLPLAPTLDRPLIIHIQDAHANYTAQKDTAQILARLKREQGIKLVFVEGAAGRLDAKNLRFSENPELNKKIADKLARMGEMTGADLYLLEDAAGLEFVGIENAAMYRKDAEYLKSVLRQEQKSRKWISAREKELERNLTRLENKELLAALRAYLHLHRENSNFSKIISMLDQLSRKYLKRDMSHSREQKEFPSLVRLLKLKNGGVISREKVDAEIKTIETFGVKIDLETGDPRRRLENLYLKLKPRGFDFRQYPHFSRYAKSRIFRHELRSKELFDEIGKWTEILISAAAKTADEKLAVQEVKDFKLQGKLLLLELNREEWKRVCSSEFIRDVLANKFAATNDAFRFYELAIAREQAFAETIRSVMKAKKADRAVIITGGFHANGMKQAFEKTAARYTVLTPSVLSGSHENYVKTMLGRKPEEIASSEIPPVPQAVEPMLAAGLGVDINARVQIRRAVARSLGEIRAEENPIWTADTRLERYFSTLSQLSDFSEIIPAEGTQTFPTSEIQLASALESVQKLSRAARRRFPGVKLANAGVSLDQNFGLLTASSAERAVIIDADPVINLIMLPFLGLMLERSATRAEFMAHVYGKRLFPLWVSALREKPFDGLWKSFEAMLPLDADSHRLILLNAARQIAPFLNGRMPEAYRWSQPQILKFLQNYFPSGPESMKRAEFLGTFAGHTWLASETEYQKLRRAWLEGRITGVAGNIHGNAMKNAAMRLTAEGHQLFLWYWSTVRIPAWNVNAWREYLDGFPAGQKQIAHVISIPYSGIFSFADVPKTEDIETFVDRAAYRSAAEIKHRRADRAKGKPRPRVLENTFPLFPHLSPDPDKTEGSSLGAPPELPDELKRINRSLDAVQEYLFFENGGMKEMIAQLFGESLNRSVKTQLSVIFNHALIVPLLKIKRAILASKASGANPPVQTLENWRKILGETGDDIKDFLGLDSARPFQIKKETNTFPGFLAAKLGEQGIGIKEFNLRHPGRIEETARRIGEEIGRHLSDIEAAVEAYIKKADTAASIRAKLIEEAQSYIDFLSMREQAKGDTEDPDIFLVLGGPDMMTFVQFAARWKEARDRSGREIPVVVAGGRGRGTLELLRKTEGFYSGRLSQAELEEIRKEDATEARIIRRILLHEGIPSDLIRLEEKSTNTPENFVNALPIVREIVTSRALAHPRIQGVTNPPLNLRVHQTGLKKWQEQIKNESWKLVTKPVYLADLKMLFDANLMTDSQLIETLAYVLGYPAAYEPGRALNRKDELARIEEYSAKSAPDVMPLDFSSLSWTPEKAERFREGIFREYLASQAKASSLGSREEQKRIFAPEAELAYPIEIFSLIGNPPVEWPFRIAGSFLREAIDHEIKKMILIWISDISARLALIHAMPAGKLTLGTLPERISHVFYVLGHPDLPFRQGEKEILATLLTELSEELTRRFLGIKSRQFLRQKNAAAGKEESKPKTERQKSRLVDLEPNWDWEDLLRGKERLIIDTKDVPRWAAALDKKALFTAKVTGGRLVLTAKSGNNIPPRDISLAAFSHLEIPPAMNYAAIVWEEMAARDVQYWYPEATYFEMPRTKFRRQIGDFALELYSVPHTNNFHLLDITLPDGSKIIESLDPYIRSYFGLLSHPSTPEKAPLPDYLIEYTLSSSTVLRAWAVREVQMAFLYPRPVLHPRSAEWISFRLGNFIITPVGYPKHSKHPDKDKTPFYLKIKDARSGYVRKILTEKTLEGVRKFYLARDQRGAFDYNRLYAERADSQRSRLVVHELLAVNAHSLGEVPPVYEPLPPNLKEVIARHLAPVKDKAIAAGAAGIFDEKIFTAEEIKQLVREIEKASSFIEPLRHLKQETILLNAFRGKFRNDHFKQLVRSKTIYFQELSGRARGLEESFTIRDFVELAAAFARRGRTGDALTVIAEGEKYYPGSRLLAFLKNTAGDSRQPPFFKWIKTAAVRFLALFVRSNWLESKEQTLSYVFGDLANFWNDHEQIARRAMKMLPESVDTPRLKNFGSYIEAAGNTRPISFEALILDHRVLDQVLELSGEMLFALSSDPKQHAGEREFAALLKDKVLPAKKVVSEIEDLITAKTGWVSRGEFSVRFESRSVQRTGFQKARVRFHAEGEKEPKEKLIVLDPYEQFSGEIISSKDGQWGLLTYSQMIHWVWLPRKSGRIEVQPDSSAAKSLGAFRSQLEEEIELYRRKFDSMMVLGPAQNDTLHTKRIRDAILKGAEGLRGTVLVLGADKMEPVAELAQQFDKVILVNLDKAVLQKSVKDIPEDLKQKIELRVLDISGLFDAFTDRLDAIIESTDLADEAEYALADFFRQAVLPPVPIAEHEADYVVSSLLMSQLDIVFRTALENTLIRKFGTGNYSDHLRLEMERLREKIQLEHLGNLRRWTAPEGKIYFADTDYKMREVSKGNEIIKRQKINVLIPGEVRKSIHEFLKPEETGFWHLLIREGDFDGAHESFYFRVRGGIYTPNHDSEFDSSDSGVEEKAQAGSLGKYVRREPGAVFRVILLAENITAPEDRDVPKLLKVRVRRSKFIRLEIAAKAATTNDPVDFVITEEIAKKPGAAEAIADIAASRKGSRIILVWDMKEPSRFVARPAYLEKLKKLADVKKIEIVDAPLLGGNVETKLRRSLRPDVKTISFEAVNDVYQIPALGENLVRLRLDERALRESRISRRDLFDLITRLSLAGDKTSLEAAFRLEGLSEQSGVWTAGREFFDLLLKKYATAQVLGRAA